MTIFRNHHDKYIEFSTNMSRMGLVIPEITCEMLEILRKQTQFCSVKPMSRVLSVKVQHLLTLTTWQA